MIKPTQPLPLEFKGIALFTPGGDVVYCIDPLKRSRWHLDLCTALQSHLQLSSPPYFLVPCYTATADCWIDPKTQKRVITAEAQPRVLRYQALLNILFQTDAQIWRPIYRLDDNDCGPSMIDAYRQQFSELWEPHGLILEVTGDPSAQDPKDSKDRPSPASQFLERRPGGQTPGGQTPERQSVGRHALQERFTDQPSADNRYRFRLFVRSDEHLASEGILRVLHQTLEKVLQDAYTLQVIDVSKHPEQAEADHVAATPTLTRIWPSPRLSISGDLVSPERIARLLG